MSRAAVRLDRDASLLRVVDIQEQLAPHVAEGAAVAARAGALVMALDAQFAEVTPT